MAVGVNVPRTERPSRRTPITAVARSRLARTGYQALRAVGCDYRAGVLLLNGRVPSYYHKQLAQEAVRTVPGVEEILNRIEVVGADRREKP
jgi:osmotically-inducible protein OsmY